MSKLLKGRIAVVTGAGSGIGRAEAIYMAQEGAKVVVNDIGTNTYGKELSHEPADAVVRQIKSAGNIALANYDSVAVEEGAHNIIQAAIDNFGRIDILVNNAGIFRDLKNIADISFEDWDPVIKTHLYGHFYHHCLISEYQLCLYTGDWPGPAQKYEGDCIRDGCACFR